MTLSGAHTLGHTHIANSGFGFLPSEVVSDKSNATTLNAWDATPNLFDNEFFVSMYIKVGGLIYLFSLFILKLC